MKMKKFMMVLMAVACFGFIVASAQAQEDGGKHKKAKNNNKPKPTLSELTVQGVITKAEVKGKSDQMMVKYTLTDADGNKIVLPNAKAQKAGKKKKAEAGTPINLEEYLDMPVKVTGQGTEMSRNDKKIVKFRKITSIEKAADTQ